ncbi:helix-turn-helix transcriptional regulator [Actinosynnema sp. CA-248983]
MTTQRASSPIWVYIEDELRKRGLTTGDLVRAIGVTRSALTGWRDGRSMTVATARSIAALFKVSILEVLVGTGVITPEEARLRPALVDPTAFADQELFLELAERLRHRLWLSSFAPTPARALGDGASDVDGRKGEVQDWGEYEELVDRFRGVVCALLEVVPEGPARRAAIDLLRAVTKDCRQPDSVAEQPGVTSVVGSQVGSSASAIVDAVTQPSVWRAVGGRSTTAVGTRRP